MVRKRGEEESVKDLQPPSEAWLMRTLAELRRAQRYGDRPVARKGRAKRRQDDEVVR
jgi:hypothetical protein